MGQVSKGIGKRIQRCGSGGRRYHMAGGRAQGPKYVQEFSFYSDFLVWNPEEFGKSKFKPDLLGHFQGIVFQGRRVEHSLNS